MKLTKIAVTNYRSLKDVNISNPLPMNMVFGVNNSGKSNIFDFISIMFRKKHEKTIVNYTDDKGLPRERVGIEERAFYEGMIYDQHFLFFKDIVKNDIHFDVSVEVDDADLGVNNIDILKRDNLYRENVDGHSNKFNFIGKIESQDKSNHKFRVDEVSLNRQKILLRDETDRLLTEESLTVSADDFKEVLEIFTDIVLMIPTKRNFAIKELFTSDIIDKPLYSKNFRNFLFSEYIDSSKNQNFNDFIDFLKKLKPSGNQIRVFEEELKYFPLDEIDLSFARFVEDIELMVNTKSGRYPLNSYGTGTQQLLFILSFIWYRKPKVLLIEEIELNLSLIYQQVLIHILKRLVEDGIIGQVFFTSHSDQFRRNDFRHYKVTATPENGTQVSEIQNIRGYYENLAQQIDNLR